jgi:hypothetical protein
MLLLHLLPIAHGLVAPSAAPSRGKVAADEEKKGARYEEVVSVTRGWRMLDTSKTYLLSRTLLLLFLL